MADTTKTIILGIELDTKQLANEAAELTKTMEDLKKKISDAPKGSVEYEELTSRLKIAKNDYRELKRFIDNTTESMDAQKGSIKQLRADLSVATKRYNELSKEQREASEEGNSLRLSILGISNELKKAEGAIGDNRRNVGNYKNAIMEAAQEMNIFGVKIGDISNGLKTGFTSTNILGLVSNVALGISNIVSNTEVWNKLTASTSKIFESFKNTTIDLLGIDIKRNEELKKSKDLHEEIRKIQSEGYDEQIENFKLLDEDYKKRKQREDEELKVLKDLGLATEVKAKYDEKSGKLIQEAYIQGYRNFQGAKEGFKLAIQDYETKKKTNDEVLKYYKTIQDTRNLSKDESNNLKLQLQYQKTLQEQNKKLIPTREYLAAIERIEANRSKQDAEELKKINDDNIQKRIDNNNRILENEKANIELLLLKTNENSAEYINLKLKLFEKQKEIELNNTKLTSNQRLLIEEKYYQMALDLSNEFLKEKTDVIIEANNKSLNSDIETINKQRLLYAIDLENKKISELEFLKLQAESLDAEAKLYSDNSEKKLQIDLAAAKLRNQISEKEKDANAKNTKATEKDKRAAAQAGLDFAANTFGTIAGYMEEGSEEYKMFASLQVFADSIKAVMAAYASAQASPITPFFPAFPAIAAATAGAFGAVQIAKINSLARGGAIFPRAEFGMVLGGNPHSSGGTKFVGSDGTRFEAEKDELLTVVNKRSTAMLRRLSDLNVAGGGINFYTGARSHLADGGMVQRSMTAQSDINMNNISQIQRYISSMPSPIVVVEDINKAQGTIVRVKSRSIL